MYLPYCSTRQQKLKIAASFLPTLDLYNSGHSATLLHPRVTSLWEEFQLEDNASSSSQHKDNTPSSPFLPLMQSWKYQRCDQLSMEAVHQTGKRRDNSYLNLQPCCLGPICLSLGIFTEHSWGPGPKKPDLYYFDTINFLNFLGVDDGWSYKDFLISRLLPGVGRSSIGVPSDC